MKCKRCGKSEYLKPDPGGFFGDAFDENSVLPAPYVCTECANCTWDDYEDLLAERKTVKDGVVCALEQKGIDTT